MSYRRRFMLVSGRARRIVSPINCFRPCDTVLADMSSPRRIAEMQPKPRPGDCCILVIFGAAGDLAKRLLIPALRNLRRAGLLPTEFAVIGVSRNEVSDETFRRDLGLGNSGTADGDAADADGNWL